MWESITGLIKTLKSLQIQIPPPFLCTTTISTGHLLPYTRFFAFLPLVNLKLKLLLLLPGRMELVKTYVWKPGTAVCCAVKVALNYVTGLILVKNLIIVIAKAIRFWSSLIKLMHLHCSWISQCGERSVLSYWSQSPPNNGCQPVMYIYYLKRCFHFMAFKFLC